MAGIVSIKPNLKGAFGFIGFLDLAFLFIEDISRYLQKGYGSILCSMSFQKFVAYPAINDLLDMCPNLWCNNTKETFFLGGNFFDLYFSVYTKNPCFTCAL